MLYEGKGGGDVYLGFNYDIVLSNGFELRIEAYARVKQPSKEGLRPPNYLQ